MIFVTVGTHEQPFDRLLKCVDKMIEEKKIKEEVIVQKGYTDYEMKNCKSYKLIGYDEMQQYIKDARIVITHGGPASFLNVLSYNKIPIVVPRRKEFNEHVNDHQFDFAKQVEERMRNIIVAKNENEIEDAIMNYDDKILNLKGSIKSNNNVFISKFENEIKDIL